MTVAEPKFHRWIDPVARGAVTSRHRLEASDAERASLARWLDIPAIESLTADLTVERVSANEAAVSGTFQARVSLVCGVSLEVFSERLTGPVSGRFRKPEGRAARHEPEPEEEVLIDLDVEEPGEWRPQGIDLASLVAEELSLAVPEFPRKPGAALDLSGAPPAEDKPNPFAALARLKGGDGEGG